MVFVQVDDIKLGLARSHGFRLSLKIKLAKLKTLDLNSKCK